MSRGARDLAALPRPFQRSTPVAGLGVVGCRSVRRSTSGAQARSHCWCMRRVRSCALAARDHAFSQMRRSTSSTASAGRSPRPHLRQQRRPAAIQLVGRCGFLERDSLLGAVSLMRSGTASGGYRLRPPRSGTEVRDETRRPQTGSLRGLQGAREDDAQQPSGAVKANGHHRLA